MAYPIGGGTNPIFGTGLGGGLTGGLGTGPGGLGTGLGGGTGLDPTLLGGLGGGAGLPGAGGLPGGAGGVNTGDPLNGAQIPNFTGDMAHMMAQYNQMCAQMGMSTNALQTQEAQQLGQDPAGNPVGGANPLGGGLDQLTPSPELAGQPGGLGAPPAAGGDQNDQMIAALQQALQQQQAGGGA